MNNHNVDENTRRAIAPAAVVFGAVLSLIVCVIVVAPLWAHYIK